MMHHPIDDHPGGGDVGSDHGGGVGHLGDNCGEYCGDHAILPQLMISH